MAPDANRVLGRTPIDVSWRIAQLVLKPPLKPKVRVVLRRLMAVMLVQPCLGWERHSNESSAAVLTPS